MAILTNIFPQVLQAQQAGNQQNAAATTINHIPPKIVSVSFARKRIKYYTQEVQDTIDILVYKVQRRRRTLIKGDPSSFDDVNEILKTDQEMMVGVIKRIVYNNQIISNNEEYITFLEQINPVRIGKRRGETVQVQVYYDSVLSREIHFDDIRKIYIGTDIEADGTPYGSSDSIDGYRYGDTYIKVETQGLTGRNIKLQIQQPQANTLLSNPLNIIQITGNSSPGSNEVENQTTEIELTVERYEDGETYTNIAAWDNHAIAKVIMLPDQDVRGANQTQWRNLINSSQNVEDGLKVIDLFFWINNIGGINNITYEGTINNLGEERQNGNLAGFKSNQGYFKMFNQRAPWMRLAFEEALKAKGAKEGREPLKERVEQHYQDHTNTSADSTGKPWCASFANWVIGNAGYKSIKKKGQRSRSFREDDSRAGIYEDVSEPFFGAIMVRRNYREKSSGVWNIGGATGHIAFVCGRIRGTNDYICLGGNQGNRLIFKKYSADTSVLSNKFKVKMKVRGTKVKKWHKQRFHSFVKPVGYTVKDSDRLLEFPDDQTDNLNTRFFRITSSGSGTR